MVKVLERFGVTGKKALVTGLASPGALDPVLPRQAGEHSTDAEAEHE